MRDIENTGGVADGSNLRKDPRGVLHWHVPATERGHAGPEFEVRLVEGGAETISGQSVEAPKLGLVR